MNIVLQENNVISNIYVITLPNFRHTKTEKKKKNFQVAVHKQNSFFQLLLQNWVNVVYLCKKTY